MTCVHIDGISIDKMNLYVLGRWSRAAAYNLVILPINLVVIFAFDCFKSK